MKKKLLACLFLPLLIISFSCGSPSAKRVIIVQPFADFPPSIATIVYNNIKEINPHTILKKAISLPRFAYYPKRNRYRADSIINYLNNFGSADTIIIGLTGKDISTNKGNIPDWGVMGLGFQPGNSCVVSAYRLSKLNRLNQLYKVALHELGHTQGLSHCIVKTCLMRDAKGGNHLNEETDFCSSCKAYLKNKGWKLR